MDPVGVDHLVAALPTRYRDFVTAAAYTGCRFGELAALRLDNVNMVRRTISIEATASEVRGVIHVGPPKTRAAVRAISIPTLLVDALAHHLGAHPTGHDGLVFTGRAGGYIRSSNFRHRVWNPAVKASVGPPCRFHDLRHSHVAMLIATGQHRQVIAQRLGHVSVRTVLDVYGHLYDGLDRAAATALDQLAANGHVGYSWG